MSLGPVDLLVIEFPGNQFRGEIAPALKSLILTWDPLVDDVLGPLSGEDIEQLGHSLALNSSAAVMLFENTWATEFRDAVVRAEGRLIMSERIPKAVIDELVAAKDIPNT